jgi:hypothetical protein
LSRPVSHATVNDEAPSFGSFVLINGQVVNFFPELHRLAFALLKVVKIKS